MVYIKPQEQFKSLSSRYNMTLTIVSDVVYCGCNPESADMTYTRGEQYLRKYFIITDYDENGNYRILDKQFDSEWAAEMWLDAGFEITEDNSTLVEYQERNLEAEWDAQENYNH